MKSQLENIELLIRQIISIEGREAEPLQQSILVEIQRTKSSFINQFPSKDPEAAHYRFFRFHADSIVSLLDEIHDKTGPFEQGNSNSATISWLYSTVENFLNFLRLQFPQFLEGFKAPKKFSENVLVDLKSEMEKLLAILSANGVDNKTTEIVAAIIQRIPKNISYESLFYLRFILSELMQIDWSNSDPKTMKQVFIDILIKLNFNKQFFMGFYTDYVTDALANVETLSERIERLGYFMKLASQAAVVPEIVADPSMPGIKVQILEWLSHEMDYYQLKLQLGVTDPKGDLLIKKDFKLIFDMSVANLAFLFKLFIETGVIQNKNTSDLIRFLAKFVKTKKAEAVSYESLRIKYYNTESGTKDAVKRTLQSLLNLINKN